MLNDSQKVIAETLEGMMVVDAGPGTGKTHTIVERYARILSKEGVDPRDVLLMTFTNNAAAEMRERLEEKVGSATLIQATTFDAFCLDLVLECAEQISDSLGMDESITRGASLVQSGTLNREYFQRVYSKFMAKHGERYGGLSALASSSVADLFALIEKLMSKGLVPLPDYDWIGSTGILEGDPRRLMGILKERNGRDMLRSVDIDDPPEWFTDGMDQVPESVLEDAVYEDRKMLTYMVHDIFREYLRSSISDNRLTFAMVELFTFSALYHDPGVRKRFSYRYVMIDEFQDTNELQLKISMLILKERNLCAVGDWKQGIYGFRNVSIDNIIGFKEKLSNARAELNRGAKRIAYEIGEVTKCPLDENYRSSQLIIDRAFSALTMKASANESMEDRSDDIVMIRAKRTEISENTGFGMVRAETGEKEIRAVAQIAFEYVTDPKYAVIENGVSRRPRYGDIAVLCKKNSTGREIRDAMTSMGMPAFLQGDIDVMSSREAKLALAWLRYVNNGSDSRGPAAIMADMGYTMEEMDAAIDGRSGRCVDIPASIRDARGTLLRKKRRMTSLLSSIFQLHGLNNDVTQTIINAIAEAHRESMLTIADVIRLMEDDMERSETYEMDASLDTDAVTIQTMHKSKGLEYPIVIIAGMNEKSFPRHGSNDSKRRFIADDLLGIRVTDEYRVRNGYHSIERSWRWSLLRSAIKTDYDEQRRLLFVAISRAKQYVTMTCHNPSMFMKGYGESHIIGIEPTLTSIPKPATGDAVKGPTLNMYKKRRIEMAVHDLMDGIEDSGGKGPEYGTIVHAAAEMIAMGRDPGTPVEEEDEIRRIMDSLKGADILVEADCIYPTENAVVKGRIDMIAVFDDRVEVHDYKTDMTDVNEERYRLQLSVYAEVAEAHFKRPAACIIDYVSQRISKTVERYDREYISRKISERLEKLNSPVSDL